jgi:hypothetical protein
MTPAELAVLAAEINEDPLTLGYASHLPGDPQRVVDLLTEQKYSMVKSRYVTARTIMAECEDGAAILDALQTLSGTISAVKWMMTFLQQNSGIDAGHPKTQKNIDDLAATGKLNGAYANELKQIAVQPAARFEVIGTPEPTARDIVLATEIQ